MLLRWKNNTGLNANLERKTFCGIWDQIVKGMQVYISWKNGSVFKSEMITISITSEFRVQTNQKEKKEERREKRLSRERGLGKERRRQREGKRMRERRNWRHNKVPGVPETRTRHGGKSYLFFYVVLVILFFGFTEWILFDFVVIHLQCCQILSCFGELSCRYKCGKVCSLRVVSRSWLQWRMRFF